MNRIYLAAIAALLTLTACGGGGGSDPVGGIDGRGDPVDVVAQGTITGFGSVIVNGVRYDTNGAEFEIDDNPGSQDDLAVGDVVVITGTVSDDGSNATATTVTFDDVVEGPVSAVDVGLGQLTVLGQTVVTDGTTSFDDNIPTASLGGIDVGDIVEVSGFRLANGNVSATRIEGKPAGGEYEVTGQVSGLSGTSFTIEGLTVDFSSAFLSNFPSGSPENGQPVEAKGTSLGPNGQLLATRVEYKGGGLGAAAGARMEVEGFITRFVSATDFDVSGTAVTTTGGTVYEGGTAASLGLNLKVEVEGDVNNNGVLVARKVDIKTATAVRVVGLIDSIPPNPLAVLGITINTDPLKTRFEDKAGDNPLDTMTIADLRVGDYIEVRGQELPQGQITAVIVERDDPDTRTELRGFVEIGGKAQPNLVVLGVTIDTTNVSQYWDSRGASEVPMTEGEFWDAVQEGSLVDARGTEADSTTLSATEVELQGD